MKELSDKGLLLNTTKPKKNIVVSVSFLAKRKEQRYVSNFANSGFIYILINIL